MLSNWDEILYLTLIEQWSPQAVYEITCIFMTNVKATQAIQ
jgi:hypothetical protein